MNINLCDLLKNELILPQTESHARSLAQELNTAEEDLSLWEIYYSMRLHQQSRAGCQDAGKALSWIRAETDSSRLLESEYWINRMRLFFYPAWMVTCGINELPACFSPYGKIELEELIHQFVEETNLEATEIDSRSSSQKSKTSATSNRNFAGGFKFDPSEPSRCLIAAKAKLASGNRLNVEEKENIWSHFRKEILNKLLTLKRKDKTAGLRACCEKYLSDQELEPYPFTKASWVSELLVQARMPMLLEDDESHKIADKIALIQSKIENRDYKFSNEKVEGCDWQLILQYKHLNGINNALNPAVYHYGSLSRHEHVGKKLHSYLDLELSQAGPPGLIAYVLARMDLSKHLEPILNANALQMESLAPWIIVELVQAGHLEKAVALVTGQSAADALAAGNKAAFEREYCMISALRRGREYTYGGTFNYLCAQIPELLPEAATRTRALHLLEKTALSDLFWLNPNEHQAESLIALAGTMLRCGEFDRAQNLFQRLFDKHSVTQESEWSIIRTAFLDASCFWYLNGNPDRMISILGDYLAMRWCGSRVMNSVDQ
jgi:hypothetical protein